MLASIFSSIGIEHYSSIFSGIFPKNYFFFEKLKKKLFFLEKMKTKTQNAQVEWTFFGETEHFSGRIGALRWSILVGKQKHNCTKSLPESLISSEPARTLFSEHDRMFAFSDPASSRGCA